MIVCDLFNFLNISNIAANKDPLAYEIFFSLVNSHCKFSNIKKNYFFRIYIFRVAIPYRHACREKAKNIEDLISIITILFLILHVFKYSCFTFEFI